MSTFCLLAYIPCIILVIWLFIELRKYVIVNKNLRHTKKVWKKVQAQREKKKSEDQFVETIPPSSPPEYAPDYNPAPGADSYSRLDDDYERELRASRRRRDTEERGYDREPYPPPLRAKPRSKHRRGPPRRRRPPPEPYEYDDYDAYYDPRARARRRPKRGEQIRKHRKRDYPDRYSYDEYHGTEDVSDDVDWE